MTQPTDLINFNCNCCHTLLTVPQSMAGVSGPCPKCGETVTAPFGLNAPMIYDLPSQLQHPVVAPPVTISKELPVAPVLDVMQPAPLVASAKPSGSRKWLFVGLGLAILGGGVAVWQSQTGGFGSGSSASAVATESTSATIVSADPKTQAIDRSCALAKKFLATPDWASARKMVAAQDVTGSVSEPAFQPEQFGRFSKSNKWSPLKVDEKENAGQFQVVWQVTDQENSEQLLLTVDDTAEGPKVRWYQPPYVVAAVGGTNGNKPKAVAETPAAPPATAPAAAPPAPVTPEATVLAVTENPRLPSNGSSALLNRKIEKAADADSTASAAPAK